MGFSRAGDGIGSEPNKQGAAGQWVESLGLDGEAVRWVVGNGLGEYWGGGRVRSGDGGLSGSVEIREREFPEAIQKDGQ